MKKIKRALISVSNKKNLKPLLKILKKNKVEIISSGGTFREIRKLKFKCIEVSQFTKSPEILDGRVKTLHPKVHAGILNKRNNKKHRLELARNNFQNIDLIVVNFYPFEQVVKYNKSHKKIIENIDIGGPTMVRAAAKNYNDVAVLTSIDQYKKLIKEMENNKGKTSLKFRQEMSQSAFSETAYYDALISDYFNTLNKTNFPKKKISYSKLIKKLRYGENPHQESAIYSKDESNSIIQLNGKELSYNNYNDIFTALAISKTLPRNIGTVIVKHANPCGVSIVKDKVESFETALACDPISAFGGIVSCNFKININLALKLNKIFFEVIIGNGFEKKALQVLKKKKNLRIIDSSKYSIRHNFNINSINQNILVQSEDTKKFSKSDFKVVSKNRPNKSQLNDLIFAFNVCRFVKSNAIVIACNKSTIGIGSGQPSRLDSCEIAINKMKKYSSSSSDVVAASDAFFPFVDGIEKLVQSGVIAVVQPAGSIRDKEIIKFANEAGIILLFSKTRHFRH